MAAKDESIIEIATIESNDRSKSVDLRVGVISIDYYEDIFSPTVTAKMLVYNTGDSIKGKDDKWRSVYNGLPLRGGERVSLKIAPNTEENAGLDYSENYQDYLYVSSITDVLHQQRKETFTLNLCSREAITNETTRVPSKFPSSSTIDVSVKKILQGYLKTEKEMDVDPVSNAYGFIGNLRKPFNIITWLASKSVSEKGNAGFFFYQTQDGYKFKSIDNLINQKPKATYEYTEVNMSDTERNNDFNILRYNTNRNQDLLEKLRLGAYSSFIATYDPCFSSFNLPQQALFSFDDKDAPNLGEKLSKDKLPPIDETAEKTLGEIPSRIMTMVLDRGVLEKESELTKNADPMEYQAQSIFRYNTLHTQELHMQVPLNTNLRAGDTIKCIFPKVTSDTADIDDEQSGLYLIKELRHHFSDRSETSMKLIRDTFGLYGVNNDNGGK
tara:strand:- start:881 stop:2203 length:1323 start_codon:yes stop_codon:yes gene_type:complete